ncbi:uncharacterized protein BHQ10_002058 [Talaromyces amestolkiae]|uniref:Ubiquitin 3 binding protein But2 C-terminal domain-containing protein n=1 Tax=Talaromyces amestolkiae TaxID=1196081 RepID=A0A364KR71_TALAM|nr:uncharacterized protein BHQ10_002058 [Talaromyces amestolkiae]RAO66046.1 hypothetical protein BHQ10_002058 [Talaromyces amestolkiae]
MLKSNVGQLLLLCTTALAILGSSTEIAQQKVLVGVDIMDEQEKVRGHNEAVYDAVPKEDQLFRVEFLEIAPTPIIADRVFFVYLRGDIPESRKKELGLPDNGLVDATITVSSSVVYPDGSYDDEQSVTLPLKTTPYNDIAHLLIRDADGNQADYLPSRRQSDIIFDFQIPTMFLKGGMWTFKADARAGDKNNSCLFAMSLTQWLQP